VQKQKVTSFLTFFLLGTSKKSFLLRARLSLLMDNVSVLGHDFLDCLVDVPWIVHMYHVKVQKNHVQIFPSPNLPPTVECNMAQVRQSKPDSGLGFQVKDPQTVQHVPSSLVTLRANMRFMPMNRADHILGA